MPFLIAYDIADPKRLRAVARRLERRAIRVQKSVFRFHSDQASLQSLLEELRPMLDLKKDMLAAWQLTSAGPQRNVHRSLGMARQIPLAAVVCSPHAQLDVEEGSR